MAASRKPFEERGVPGPVHGLAAGSPITFIRSGSVADVFVAEAHVLANVVQVRAAGFLAQPADRTDTFLRDSLQSFRYTSEGIHWIRGHHTDEGSDEMRAWASARALSNGRA